jgi:glycosyltransferase involved in cell wall biosynthesis
LADRVHPPVTFVASHAELGGQEAYLRTVLASLPPGSVHGVVSLHDGPGVPALAALGFPLWVVPTPARLGMARAIVSLRRVLRANGTRLVHADGIKAALCSVLALRGTGVPVVWVKHDAALDGRLARWVARRCALVVGVSETVTRTFDGVGGVRARVVTNGVAVPAVDRAQARAELLRLLGAAPDAPLVIQVGRLVATKGQRDLVEAAALVHARRPEVRFAVVGDPDRHAGEYAAGLRARAQELGLGEVVGFLGYRPEAVRLIAGADLLVVPSLRPPGLYGGGEGFGLVAAEGMAVGTPVVAYDVPALPDTLGGCGRLVPEGDHAALAAAIEALLEDEAERSRMAACGRARAEQFSLERAVAGLAEAYAEAADAPA